MMKAGIIIILNNGFICTLGHDTMYLMVRSQQYVFLEYTLMLQLVTELLQGWGLAHPL